MTPARPHVLLVEDDTDTREVLRLILESDGMEVTPVQDGLDALARQASAAYLGRREGEPGGEFIAG